MGEGFSELPLPLFTIVEYLSLSLLLMVIFLMQRTRALIMSHYKLPLRSHVYRCAWRCEYRCGSVSVSVWLSLCSTWPLISLICSTHRLILSPVLHHSLSLHSRWLQQQQQQQDGACDTTRCASTPPCYLISLFLFTPDLLEPSSSRGKEMHKQKTTSLNSEILSYSFERSGSTHHISLGEANWFNLLCLHHA